MSARIDVMSTIERNAYVTWFYGAARVKQGTCDTCHRNRHDDGGPLTVARQPRFRKFECLSCWEGRH